MAGTMTIPNTLSTQSGNVPATQFDANWQAPATYVNAREIAMGALASRPSAGTAGRWYCATDTASGTLYVDTGSAWIQVAAGVTGGTPGAYQARGLTGVNTTATPNTKFDLAADLVEVRNPSDGSNVVRTNTGTLTNDTGVAGSAANGRDQAGAFSTSIFLHFYFIWNGSTLATLSSQTAPPTGPTLPSGYTHWAYAAAVWNAAGPILRPTIARGSQMFLSPKVSALSDGRATVETSVSLSSIVPSNALSFRANTMGLINNLTKWTVRVRTGEDFYAEDNTGALTVNQRYGTVIEYPNVSQQIFYLNGADPTAGYGVNVDVVAYRIPNGGE